MSTYLGSHCHVFLFTVSGCGWYPQYRVPQWTGCGHSWPRHPRRILRQPPANLRPGTPGHGGSWTRTWTCGFVSLSALSSFDFDENVRPLAFKYSEMEPEVYYKSFSFKSKFRIPPSGRQRYHELSTNVSISNLIHINLEYLLFIFVCICLS